MDLAAALGQFFDERGRLALPPQASLPAVAEQVYQAEEAQGLTDRHVLRYWDYSRPEGQQAVDYTRAQVATRIKAVAARLQQVAEPGERVAVLAGNTPEYMFSFLGALYAGLVPVPLYDPQEPGHADHLRAVLDDSRPGIVLTDRRSARAVRSWFTELPGPERPRIVAVDALPDAIAATWRPAPQDGESVAFLQYTSGSTRRPAGVELTHRSVLSNILQIFRAGNLRLPMRLVHWLPLHHDMGVILAAFAIVLGIEMDLMAPRDFVQRPYRWVEQLSRREPGAPGQPEPVAFSAVPNFALELAVRYGAPREGDDFSQVDGIIVGSEPVTPRALEAVSEAFGPYGLRTAALRPSYGLAEASLLVTTPISPVGSAPGPAKEPVVTFFDREELAQGRAVVVPEEHPRAVGFVSNGSSIASQELTVVDPESAEELPEGRVGELWVHGPNLAAGYVDRPEDTAATFHRTLRQRLAEGSRAGEAPDDGWLATGDLCAVLDGEVYITGRLKDLIVIAGRNHYPQDVERTVAGATAQVSPTAVAAFSVPGEDVERLVILAERAADADPAGDEAAATAIRAAVSSAHGIPPTDIQILDAGSIARSSSAKIARRVARARYLENHSEA